MLYSSPESFLPICGFKIFFNSWRISYSAVWSCLLTFTLSFQVYNSKFPRHPTFFFHLLKTLKAQFVQTIYSQVPNHSWARSWPSSLHAEILNDLSLLAFCVCCHVLWVHTCSFSGVFRKTCFCVIIRHLTVSPPSVPCWFPSLGRRNGIVWACVRLSIVFYSLHLDQLWTFVNCCLIHKEASLRPSMW